MNDGEELGNGGGSDLPESNAATSDAPPMDAVAAAADDVPAGEASDEAAEVPATTDAVDA